MQVSCFGINWDEIQKRGSGEKIVEEMICTDDVDMYTITLPDGLWISDSANQHFDTADKIESAKSNASIDHKKALDDLSKLISNGESIDELGLSPLTEGCYFISISPDKISSLLESFHSLDLNKIKEIDDSSKQWIRQWQSALEFACSKRCGLIGHCG